MEQNIPEEIVRSCREFIKHPIATNTTWRDVTTYSRGDTEKIPRAFGTKLGMVNITIVYGHVRQPQKWIFHCPELNFDTQVIRNATTAKNAAENALILCRERAKQLYGSFCQDTMDKDKLAEWMHDNYEQLAKSNNWLTQEAVTRVKFEDLPPESKNTMLALANEMLSCFFVIPKNIVVSESLPPEVIYVLLNTLQAYQGVGDFEGTGKNMVSVVGDIRKVLRNHGVDWQK